MKTGKSIRPQSSQGSATIVVRSFKPLALGGECELRTDRGHGRRAVEQSLARMRTDHLDVLQFHISPSRRTLEEHGALDTVLELKRAGTVRFFPRTTMSISRGV